MKTQIKKIVSIVSNEVTCIIMFIVSIVSIANAATTIEVTTNILVRDVRGLGINMNDSYYGWLAFKTRNALNFEGIRYRQIHNGVCYTNGFISSDFVLNDWADPWTSNVYLGCKFRLLSEPVHGITGTVVGLSEGPLDKWQNGNITTNMIFEFDRVIDFGTNAVRGTAIMIEDTRHLTSGFMGVTNDWWNNGCEIVTNDSPPGSFGNSSCKIGPGRLIRSIASSSYAGRTSGKTFRIEFKAKKHSESPTLVLDSPLPDEIIPLTDSWVTHERFIVAPRDGLTITFQNKGSGAALIDDIFIEQLDSNPSRMRDDIVDLYKKMNIGITRCLSMGGWSIEDQIRPWNQTYHYRAIIGSKFGPYTGGPHLSKSPVQFGDLFSSCEAIGNIPWCSVPGAIYPEEMDTFIEFVAGPTNTPWGKVRAEDWNHPKPYTETLEKIIVEFGNEAWNTFGPFNARGYYGDDYWLELITRAKSNPYYTNNLEIIAAGQNWSVNMARNILENATNADLYAIAPYVTHGIDESDFEPLDPTMKFETDETRDNLFKWFMAYPMLNVYEDGLPQQYEVSKEFDVEYALYEFNYHCTSGNAPKAPRRLFTMSMAHGVSMANYSLAILKEAHIRNQCFFTSSGRNIDNVALWGSILNGGKYDNNRRWEAVLRPAAYANLTANRVRKGNLMETVHSGEDPLFSSYGVFEGDLETNEYKKIYSYAFQQDNGTNGIILFNYDLNNTQDVEIILKEYVKDGEAQCWELSANHYTNANDWIVTNSAGNFEYGEFYPMPVEPTNYTISGFESGYSLSMKPCSEYVFKWVRDASYPNLHVSSSNLTVPEGGSTNFILKLTADPIKGPITATVERVSGDTNIFVQSGSPAVLDSGNWDTGVIITIAASEDPDAGIGSAIFICSAPGMNSIQVEATEIENDLGIVLSTTAVSIPEGSSANFQVKLSMDPGGDLTVSSEKTSGDANISVSGGASLVFNSGNWDSYRTVTLSAADDGDIENGVAIISCSAPGVETQTVTATEIDDDTVGLVVIPPAIFVDEGSSNIFNVTLSAIPPDNSTVQVVHVSGDTDLYVSDGEFLVFDSTDWDVNHPVTISAAEDADKKNGEAVFRCQPLFPNTDGPENLIAIKRDSDAVSISFQDGVSNYTGTADSYISDWGKNDNYGKIAFGYIEAQRMPVIKWDLTVVPGTANVVSAAITLTIDKAGERFTNSFELTVYALKTAWIEGDNTAGVTWNTSDGVTPWTAGTSGSSDRGEIVGKFQVPRPVSGRVPVIINLNDAGIAYIQNCINNPSENFGFIFPNEDSGERRYLRLRETDVVSERPELTIGYYFGTPVPPTNATIVINGGDAETTNLVISLALYAEPTPVSMRFSEVSNLIYSAAWLDFTSTYEYTLGIPFGDKTVYAQFSDGGAGVSDIVSDEIELLPEPGIVFSIQCSVFGFLWFRRRV